MDRRTFLRRVAPVGAVAVAGCSGGEPTETEASTDTQTATDTTTTTPTTEGTATAEETATGTPTTEPDVTVTVAPGGSLRFDPETFTVVAGDTVQWVWESSGHNVTPGSAPSGSNWQGKTDDLYSSGTTYAHTFEVTGEYEYYCEPHRSSGMVGSFTVE
jgi:plastocyanin